MDKHGVAPGDESTDGPTTVPAKTAAAAIARALDGALPRLKEKAPEPPTRESSGTGDSTTNA